MFVVCYTHFKDLINLHDITSYHNFILLAINYAKKKMHIFCSVWASKKGKYLHISCKNKCLMYQI